ncbi:hypothetical protein ACFQH2_00015 [Natronoarchaeum sp. GCM10025703]|uniref:hypothetical protein n=1 Tax=Natronoarchaeum sp. GCM10025703 TaxID=3252685 RepID=UPI00361B3B80
MNALPLQLLDTFLLDYHIGHVLALTFVLVMLGSPLRSRKILALNAILFGVIFIAVPFSMTENIMYRLVGFALVIVAPILYTTAE